MPRKEFAPSFQAVGPDSYELLTLTEDATAAIEELRLLGVTVPEGFVPRLVEAKHDPAAWHRDEAFTNGKRTPAVTRGIVRRRWLFDFAAMPAQDVKRLVDWVMERKPAATIKDPDVDSAVAVPSDWQLGKVDSRGGTKETINRVMDGIDQAVDLFRSMKPKRIRVFDPGDILENFDNTPGQSFTNDLSLPEQVDLAATLTTRMLKSFAEVAPTDYYAVPSNHCQWRRGGKAAGKPADDWGINNARQLARVFGEAGRDDITITIPEPFRESLVVDIDGLPIGMAHGHQANNPDKLVDWWRGQTFGNQPMAAARLAIFGHYHSWRLQEVGDSKHLLVAKTSDSGSSWFTNLKGEDSSPGMVTFTVTDGRWNHLQVVGGV